MYLGHLPGAPGTWASLGSVAAGLAFGMALGTCTAGIIMLAVAFALLLVGISVGTWAETFYGKKDPQQFVLDEFVGQGIAMGAVMMMLPSAEIRVIAPAVFISFRVFDILKIFPANRAEKLAGGTGIMLDDIIAGVYAAIVSVVFLMAIR